MVTSNLEKALNGKFSFLWVFGRIMIEIPTSLENIHTSVHNRADS